ncbi:MAG: uroporphyrinogen decarboxylase family protein [Sedimentisphaerales bacterium]
MATLKGEAVDRPAVNFYEIGGFKVNPKDPDGFNIYNSPSWQPLLQLAEEKTDLIRMRKPLVKARADNPYDSYFKSETHQVGSSIFTKTSVTIGGRTLTSLTRRDADIDTVWNLEHLLKDVDDLKAYLELPDEIFDYEYNSDNLAMEDKEIGDRGIVMVDLDDDAVCNAFMLFSMADFTIAAMTEQALFHKLLEKFARPVYKKVEQISRQFPSHLWRVCGAEVYAEPYLPPTLFKDYVLRYQKPVVDIIHKYGGYARIHCHGRIKNILPYIAAMEADAIDPIEPPHQGDIELSEVRELYGNQMVLFGNLEIADIENLALGEFKPKVVQALRDGTAGKGRGFVLMPSASPYGRAISINTMKNYETVVECVENWNGFDAN